MTAKKKAKAKSPRKPQIERFIEAAREHGADKDDGELERAFGKIAPKKPGKR